MNFQKDRVLITGATAGIGRALAFKFASEKYDLVLIARDLAILEDLKTKLIARFDCEVEVISKDLSQPKSADEVFSLVHGEIDVLVNNAGFGIHGAFTKTDIDEESQLVQLQIVTFLRLTKLVLPGMIRRNRGHILNISSVYAFTPVPYQSVYAACKSFMMSFSESLRGELKDTKVKVTVVYPGSTKTEFRRRAGIKDKSNKGMTPEQVAGDAYEALTKSKRKSVPGFWNKLFVLLTCLLPNSILPAFISRINKARGVNATIT